MIAATLGAAEVPWIVGAEANGWELIAHFAALGLGLAIVNGFCRVPSGLVARPLSGLPPVTYSILSRQGAMHGDAVAILHQLIIECAARRTAE
jgi:DNA-binding transcriptional LysR family regulator